MAQKKTLLTAPSVLSANFSHMADDIALITNSKADMVHLDVMDGSFVPEITFGSKFIRDIRPLTNLPFDTHLMVEHPETMIDSCIDAGSDYVTFHLEAAVHAHRIIERIRSAGCKPGISIVPSTPVRHLDALLTEVDLILIMTVNPGYGGQGMIPFCLDKIRYLDAMRREHGYSYRISVDGGINAQTVELIREAGADIAVAGNAFFSAPDPAQVISLLKFGPDQ